MLSKNLIGALDFAAEKHKYQRRKGQAEQPIPYINHPIRVAWILSHEGQIDDEATLMAALLHDTIEDTDATGEEIENLFGVEVRQLVEEVTDDKTQAKAVRKQAQIDHTPHMSKKAQTIKLADKTSNLRDMMESPPDWPLERKQAYFDWANKVIEGLRGVHPKLEAHFDAAYAKKNQLA